MTSVPANDSYEFGPFRVDPVRRILLRDSGPVALSPKAFEMLLALVENGGEVLEKDELMQRVWPDQFVEEANLTVNMSQLRKALGERPDEHRYIVTIPGRGYRFVASVRKVKGEAADLAAEKRAHSVAVEEKEASAQYEAEQSFEQEARSLISSRQKKIKWRPSRTSLALGLALTALALALPYFWFWRGQKEIKPRPRSMAVLPFEQLGAEAGDEYFGIGIADVLITRLSNIHQIVVRPTSAVLKYTEQAQDPVAAGRELKVDSVLEGSVHRAGEQIRVTVRLVSVRDGALLWAEKFDAKFTDIFRVQDSISEQVARALTLELTGEEQTRLIKRYTDNTEAYQAYLKGRYFLNRRTEEDFEKGIKYFQQAIDLDPNYALAYAGLADSYALLVVFGVLPPREAMPKAKTAALKALEIDPNLAEAHTSLAHVKHCYEWDFAGAEEEYKRAIELNPNYAIAYHWYGLYLARMGRFDEAVGEMERSQEIDPFSLANGANLGWTFYAARRYDQAIEQLNRTLEMDPNFARARLYLGRAFVQKGMYAEAIAEFQKAMTLSGGSPIVLAALGHVYGVLGKRDEAQKVLDQLRERANREYISPYEIARVCISLGDKDQAFTWLEQAYEDREERVVLLKVDPLLDSLRPDPRFADLLRRVRLAP